MGLAEPELEHLVTLISDFQSAIECRSYRLEYISLFRNNDLLYRDSVFMLVYRLCMIVLHLEKFDLSDSITLLWFLRLIQSSFNAPKLSEKAACSLIF